MDPESAAASRHEARCDGRARPQMWASMRTTSMPKLLAPILLGTGLRSTKLDVPAERSHRTVRQRRQHPCRGCWHQHSAHGFAAPSWICRQSAATELLYLPLVLFSQHFTMAPLCAFCQHFTMAPGEACLLDGGFGGRRGSITPFPKPTKQEIPAWKTKANDGHRFLRARLTHDSCPSSALCMLHGLPPPCSSNATPTPAPGGYPPSSRRNSEPFMPP